MNIENTRKRSRRVIDNDNENDETEVITKKNKHG